MADATAPRELYASTTSEREEVEERGDWTRARVEALRLLLHSQPACGGHLIFRTSAMVAADTRRPAVFSSAVAARPVRLVHSDSSSRSRAIMLSSISREYNIIRGPGAQLKVSDADPHTCAFECLSSRDHEAGTVTKIARGSSAGIPPTR